MSHYHHRHTPLLPSPEPPLNLAPGRAVYQTYPAGVRYAGHQPVDRYQPRPPSSYPLPWSYHPQYGEVPHQPSMPVNIPPSSQQSRQHHQSFRQPPYPAPQQQQQPPGPPKLYQMPSPAMGSPVHMHVDANGRTGSHDGSVNSSVSPDPENIKDHCDSIIQHPLFPLLRLLLEKLEEATLTAVTPSPEEINSELENLVRLIQQSSASVSTGRPDIDDLMLQAVTVLRLHIFELEKVNELCRDFCDRYTACLRKNLHTDQILRADSFDLEDDEPALNGHPRADSRTGSSSFSLPATMPSVPHTPVYDLIPNQQGFGNQPHVHMDGSGSSQTMHREDDSGHLGRETLSPGSAGDSMYDDGEKYDPDQEDSSSPAAAGGKMNRRGILPKDAINTMKTWLFQHIMHPYPTEDEKRILSGQTRLSLLQVNNWFINARRRILQPMLDASNPGGTGGHRPKKGMQSRPVDPFWTGSGPATASAAQDHANNAGGPQKPVYTQENHFHGDGNSDAESSDGHPSDRVPRSNSVQE